jgi:ubiquinone/menaquinone biosynthesis C-methylase UbiE
MLRITRGKLRRALATASLAQARAQALPFRGGAFDSIVMTFPPGFVYQPQTLAEFSRVLAENGRLIWVDAGRLLPRDRWSRTLNRAFDAVDGEVRFVEMAGQVLAQAGFQPSFETVRDEASVVMVVTAVKRQAAGPF